MCHAPDNTNQTSHWLTPTWRRASHSHDRAHEQSDKTGSFPLFDPAFASSSLRWIALSSSKRLVTWPNAGNFASPGVLRSQWLADRRHPASDRIQAPQFLLQSRDQDLDPLWLAVAAIYLLSAFRDPVTTSLFKCLLYDTTFTHNWFIPKVPEVIARMPLKGTGAHFWSISVDEQFYLAAPLLIVSLPFGRSILFWVDRGHRRLSVARLVRSISLGVLAAVVRFRFGDWQLKPPRDLP